VSNRRLSITSLNNYLIFSSDRIARPSPDFWAAAAQAAGYNGSQQIIEIASKHIKPDRVFAS
jgi:hypothetical protein|tara:strand:- start:623 stop:808 length:186 start_codon:yes stop_codon:yes gene_type:complete